jgi:hypothetical protein
MRGVLSSSCMIEDCNETVETILKPAWVEIQDRLPKPELSLTIGAQTTALVIFLQ